MQLRSDVTMSVYSVVTVSNALSLCCRIFWTDAGENQHSIESCDVNGGGRKVVLRSNLPHPFGITLDDERLYWTDWDSRAISSADKETGTDVWKVWIVWRNTFFYYAAAFGLIQKETLVCCFVTLCGKIKWVKKVLIIQIFCKIASYFNFLLSPKYLRFIDMRYSLITFLFDCKPGLTKLRPAGRIQPADQSNPARQKPCTFFSSTTFPTVDSSATTLTAAWHVNRTISGPPWPGSDDFGFRVITFGHPWWPTRPSIVNFLATFMNSHVLLQVQTGKCWEKTLNTWWISASTTSPAHIHPTLVLWVMGAVPTFACWPPTTKPPPMPPPLLIPVLVQLDLPLVRMERNATRKWPGAYSCVQWAYSCVQPAHPCMQSANITGGITATSSYCLFFWKKTFVSTSAIFTATVFCQYWIWFYWKILFLRYLFPFFELEGFLWSRVERTFASSHLTYLTRLTSSCPSTRSWRMLLT